MTIEVFGAGFGRTGTMSLKLALEALGFGPCHHMDDVMSRGEAQVSLWNDAYAGQPDFAAIYAGYRAAVDWPTAAFWRELAKACPKAKVILSTRTPESWYASMAGTILPVLAAPAAGQPWLEMVKNVVLKRSLGGRTDKDDLIATFTAHEAAVKAEIAPERLLVFDVRQGWEPLCRFLDKPVPDSPFPRTNTRDEFLVRQEAGLES